MAKEVEFVKSDGQVFSIARDLESALYMLETSKTLKHSVRIEGVYHGNGLLAKCAIEGVFNS